jgi:Fe2+ or Zn2+ uptake regulation protein
MRGLRTMNKNKLYHIVHTFIDENGYKCSKHYRNMELIVCDKTNGIITFEGNKDG